jgi:hypothetical protein
MQKDLSHKGFQLKVAGNSSFAADAVRLELRALAYNLANFMRTLELPGAVKQWSFADFVRRSFRGEVFSVRIDGGLRQGERVGSSLKGDIRSVFKRNVILALYIALCTSASSLPAHAKAQFTEFSISGSTGTVPSAINDAGSVTGSYLDASGAGHGFVRAADGTITTFDVPGGSGTFPTGINVKGVITGSYVDGKDTYHGFVRAANGTITTFDPPGSDQTEVWGINKQGAVTGYYSDTNGVHGFVRAADGTITTFDPSSSISTTPLAINDKGSIAGYYLDGDYAYHGFVRASDGTITSFDVPGSSATLGSSINDKGSIAGICSDGLFVRAPDGSFTTFQISGSQGNTVVGINDKGTVVGWYDDSENADDSFFLSSGGKFTSFDAPHSDGVATKASSVNDAGLITGSYLESNYRVQGFIRSPK